LERDTPASDQENAAEVHTTIQLSTSTSELPAQSITLENPIEEAFLQVEIDISAKSSNEDNTAQLLRSQHAHHARPPPKISSLILDRIKLLEEKAKNKT